VTESDATPKAVTAEESAAARMMLAIADMVGEKEKADLTTVTVASQSYFFSGEMTVDTPQRNLDLGVLDQFLPEWIQGFVSIAVGDPVAQHSVWWLIIASQTPGVVFTSFPFNGYVDPDITVYVAGSVRALFSPDETTQMMDFSKKTSTDAMSGTYYLQLIAGTNGGAHHLAVAGCLDAFPQRIESSNDGGPLDVIVTNTPLPVTTQTPVQVVGNGGPLAVVTQTPVHVVPEGGVLAVAQTPTPLPVTIASPLPLPVNVTSGTISVNQPVWTTLYNPTTPITRRNTTGASERAAAERNRRMHSQNGNQAGYTTQTRFVSEDGDDGGFPGVGVALGPTPRYARDEHGTEHTTPLKEEMLMCPDLVPENEGAESMDQLIQRMQGKLGPWGYYSILFYQGYDPTMPAVNEEVLPVVEETDIEPPKHGGRKGPVGQQRSKNGYFSGERDAKVYEPPVPPHNVQVVAERVQSKMRTWEQVWEWIQRTQPKRDWKLFIIERAMNRLSGSKYARWMVLCNLYELETAAAAAGWARLATVVDVRRRTDFDAWFARNFSTSVETASSWLACQCDKWNALTYALNGNPIFLFPENMNPVVGAKGARALMSTLTTPTAAFNFNPVAAVEAQSGIQSAIGATDATVPLQTPLRGGFVSEASTQVTHNMINQPESVLFPRQYRNADGDALVADTTSMPIWRIGQARNAIVYGQPIATTQLIDLQASQQTRGNAKPEQTTTNGFFTTDAIAYGRVQSWTSDSFASLLLKARLLQSTLAWNVSNGDRNTLPINQEVSKYNQQTLMPPAGDITLGYNVCPVSDEDCGGATSYLPYTGGATGTISFHVSATTLPRTENVLVLALSAGLCWLEDQPSLTGASSSINYAITALLWSVYPSGIWTAAITTTDGAEGHPLTQFFVPHSSAVLIGGYTSIAILLPTLNATGLPGTQQEANRMAVVEPSTGPTASTNLLANTVINVNYVGGNFIGINLAEYLYTWLAQPRSPITATRINTYITYLCDLFGRWREWLWAWEVASVFTAWYPVMNFGVVDTVIEFDSNSEEAKRNVNAIGLKPGHAPASTLLGRPKQLDFRMLEPSQLLWLQVMMGLRYAAPDGYVPSAIQFDQTPQRLQYAIHTARQYAVTANVMYRKEGYSATVWNSIFGETQFRSIQAHLRMYYITSEGALTGGSDVVAPAGSYMSQNQAAITGSWPAADGMGNSLWSYWNIPQTGVGSPQDSVGTEITSVVPMFLADIWINVSMPAPIRELIPFPPPFGQMTGIIGTRTGALGMEYEVAKLIQDRAVIPAFQERFASSIGQFGQAHMSSSQVWNMRVAWHSFACAIYTVDGAAVAETPVTEHILTQRFVPPDQYAQYYRAGVIQTAQTAWFSSMLVDGRQLTMRPTSANDAAALTQILAGVRYAALGTWLMNSGTALPLQILGSTYHLASDIWVKDTMSYPTGRSGVEDLRGIGSVIGSLSRYPRQGTHARLPGGSGTGGGGGGGGGGDDGGDGGGGDGGDSHRAGKNPATEKQHPPAQQKEKEKGEPREGAGDSGVGNSDEGVWDRVVEGANKLSGYLGAVNTLTNLAAGAAELANGVMSGTLTEATMAASKLAAPISTLALSQAATPRVGTNLL
jgi:hypothetical protein